MIVNFSKLCYAIGAFGSLQISLRDFSQNFRETILFTATWFHEKKLKWGYNSEIDTLQTVKIGKRGIYLHKKKIREIINIAYFVKWIG